MKLALKVGAQKMYENSTTNKSVSKERFAKDSTYKKPSDDKSIPKPQVKSKVQKQHQESTSKRCYKCQGLGHIASKCPNIKVISLIEEYEAKEEDVEQVIKSNHVQEYEEKNSLLSKFELHVEEVVESNHVQEDEKSLLLSNFCLEIKDVSDVTTLVVEEIKCEKKFLQEMKPILEFVDVMLEEIPHGLPLIRNIQHQIDLIPSWVFPNKLASIMSPKEHEELKTQVDDLLDKGLVQENKSSYVVPTMLVHEKDGSWRMCFD